MLSPLRGEDFRSLLVGVALFLDRGFNQAVNIGSTQYFVGDLRFETAPHRVLKLVLKNVVGRDQLALEGAHLAASQATNRGDDMALSSIRLDCSHSWSAGGTYSATGTRLLGFGSNDSI